MPSPLAHTLLGLTLFHLRPAGWFSAERRGVLFWAWLLVAPLAPDLDFLPGMLLGDHNRYHQLFSHSLLPTFLFTLVWAGLGRRLFPEVKGLRWVLLLLSLVWSHLLLDYFTLDTRPPIGFPLFWPFSGRLFTSPVSVFPPLLRDWTLPGFWTHNLFTLAVEGLVLSPLWITARKWTTVRTK